MSSDDTQEILDEAFDKEHVAIVLDNRGSRVIAHFSDGESFEIYKGNPIWCREVVEAVRNYLGLTSQSAEITECGLEFPRPKFKKVEGPKWQ